MKHKQNLPIDLLRARQAWDFKKWMYQVARLDLSICEISCLQKSEGEILLFAKGGQPSEALAKDGYLLILRDFDIHAREDVDRLIRNRRIRRNK